MHIATPQHAAGTSRPQAFATTQSGRVLLVVSASLFVAVCAHVSIPLPFTPVPLTLSDLAVLMVGLALGPAAGFAALVLYLCEGAAGLPVFNPTGPGGIAQMLGPTGGFLFAYPFAAAAAGALRRAFASFRSGFVASALAGACGSALIMLSGLAWFASLLHLSLRAAFLGACAPFLAGQVVKVLCAAGIVTSFSRLRRA